MSLRVAVVGGGVGGLTAAGWLAVHGHQVTLYEAGSSTGGKCGAVKTSSGVTLDTGPTLLTLPEIVKETFSHLNAADLLPPLTELTLQCDYRWQSGERLQMRPSLEQTRAQAEAFGPGEGAAFEGFYEDARRIWEGAGVPYLEKPYEGFTSFMWRVMQRGRASLEGARFGSLASLARRYFRSPQLQQFAGRFATYAGASPFKASETFALIPHLERTQGVFHPRGGMGAVSEALESAARRLGVTVHLNTRVEWKSEGRKFRVGPRDDLSLFDAVIANTDPLRPLGRTHEPLALSGYVLLLEADRRLTLPHHAISFSQDERAEFEALFSGQLPKDPTLYVCHPAATDETSAPEGRSGLFVMINAPALAANAPADAWPWASRARALCLNRLHKDFPELRGARLAFLEERTPMDLARLGAPGGSIYGYLPHGVLGTFRRPAIRGPTPGLYFAGGGTHPGGGVPMVMLSGRFAAELLMKEVA